MEVLFGHVAMRWGPMATALNHWRDHFNEVPKVYQLYQYIANLNYPRTRCASDKKPISLSEAVYGAICNGPLSMRYDLRYS